MVVISYMADGDGVCRDTHNAQCYYEGLYLYKYTRNDTMCCPSYYVLQKGESEIRLSPFYY